MVSFVSRINRSVILSVGQSVSSMRAHIHAVIERRAVIDFRKLIIATPASVQLSDSSSVVRPSVRQDLPHRHAAFVLADR